MKARQLVSYLRRWWHIPRAYRYYDADLNRRAAVEQQLLNCYRGIRPLPDAEQCKEWALKLGVPDQWRKV